jgi:assimilatory nitrate reductase catalytic subunit
VAKILGIPLEKIPAQNSLPYHQILERIDSGAIKGLWVIATNPAHSWIGQKQFQDVLAKLEFLVVQDLYATTETAQQAHLVLPAAGWGEKEGTFINSERRIGLSKKVSRAPGQALADFHIFRLVAHYWGCAPLFREWSSPQAVFQIMKRLSAGRPCDITGIEDYRHLDASGGIQWPYLPGHSLETSRRLFEDGGFHHPDRKARFIFEAPRPLPEDVSKEYPFILLTGRGTTAEWHTGSRTSKSDILRQLAPSELHVEMNPQDARRIGVGSHSIIRLASPRGHLEARVMVSASIPRGQLYLPMHSPLTNRLTLPVFDPYSHQPGYKFATVRVEKLKAKR